MEVRSAGPVSGDAAMPYSTAAMSQHVPHDRATVRANRAARADPVWARTDTTARAMPIANHAK
jgi:hypothetical protein